MRRTGHKYRRWWDENGEKQSQLTGYISTANTLHRSLLMFTLVYIKSLNVMTVLETEWKKSVHWKICGRHFTKDKQHTQIHNWKSERTTLKKRAVIMFPSKKGMKSHPTDTVNWHMPLFLCSIHVCSEVQRWDNKRQQCEWKSIHFYGSQTIIQINTENLLEIELKCPLVFSS